jgi:hypothetical protein
MGQHLVMKRHGAVLVLVACGSHPTDVDEHPATAVVSPVRDAPPPAEPQLPRPPDPEDLALAWVPPTQPQLRQKRCRSKPHMLPDDASESRGSPVGPGGGTSLYATLFAEGACFRFRVSHRTRVPADDETGAVAVDQVETGSVDCVVFRVRRMHSVVVSEVRCETRAKFELTGNPAILGPDIAPARIYVASAAGLAWTHEWPKTSAEIDRVLKNPRYVVYDAARPGSYDKDTSDEDVSFTTVTGLDDAGRWCWQQTERDDYVLIERLCFARGNLVEARRVHARDDDGIDTFVYEWIE